MFGYRPMDKDPGALACPKKHDPFQTSYKAMIQGTRGVQSSFPPGYSGFLPDTKFKFGYGNVGPDFKTYSAVKPSSADSGVKYDLRPGQYVNIRRAQSTPHMRRTIDPENILDTTRQAVAISTSDRQFCQTAWDPCYLEKKEKTGFPFYRPLGGKSGCVAPGSQYPSHPSPSISGHWTTASSHAPEACVREANLRAPLGTFISNTWGTCCGGYRPNSVALGRVTWVPRQTDSDSFISTYTREMSR